jgi:hypothetical protein
MIVLIAAILLIFIFEGLPLIKKKMWKELAAAGLLIILAVFIQISQSLNILTPIDILEKIFEPVGKIIFKQY